MIPFSKADLLLEVSRFCDDVGGVAVGEFLVSDKGGVWLLRIQKYPRLWFKATRGKKLRELFDFLLELPMRLHFDYVTVSISWGGSRFYVELVENASSRLDYLTDAERGEMLAGVRRITG